METNRPTITPQGFVGVFIVLLGIVFTLDNLGLVQSRQVLQYWPLAPIGIGLLIVIHASETRDWVRGSVWLGAGSLLLARNLGWVQFRIEAFWPLLLVFFGLHIIFKAREDPSERIDRRVEKLRRRQERWQRRVERWKADHQGQQPPWAEWSGSSGTDWAKQFSDKMHETSSKFQDDWHQKFHEKFNKDWADKLKHTVQTFATGTSDAAQRPPVDSNPQAPPPPSPTSGSTETGASAAGAGAGASYTAPPPSYGPSSPPSSSSNSGHRVSMFSFMSGITRRVRGVPFPGGNLTAVMGGIELDLTQAQLPDDAVIELFAFWGGIEVRVPREWSVVNQGFALMGSIEDKTGNLPQRPGQPRLVLRGMALMGGVEIKN